MLNFWLINGILEANMLVPGFIVTILINPFPHEIGFITTIELIIGSFFLIPGLTCAGLVAGLLWASSMAYAERQERPLISPLKNPMLYRRFTNRLTFIPLFLLWFLSGLLFVIEGMFVDDFAICFYFLTGYVAWRLYRVNSRFIRFYFDDERKQKAA